MLTKASDPDVLDELESLRRVFQVGEYWRSGSCGDVGASVSMATVDRKVAATTARKRN